MSTMTWNDTVDMLSLAAVYDQRTVGDHDVRGWLLVAEANRWERAAVQRAIVEHYGSGTDRPRVTPAAITDRLRAVRRAAAASFEGPRIPDNLAAADYPSWLRDRLAEHVDAELAGWAATGAEPGRAPNVIAAPLRTIRELVAAAPPEQRASLSQGTQRMLTRRVPLDPVRREQAVAELDEVRRAVLAVACPHCAADPGQVCTRPGQDGAVPMLEQHPARHEAAIERAAS